MKPIQLGGIAVKCNPLVVFVIPTAAVFGLLDVLLLSVISLGIHEFAHLIFAKRLGVRVIELEILPIGCVARIDPDSLAISRDELFIALAGPISSLSIGITLYAVFGILEKVLRKVPARQIATELEKMMGCKLEDMTDNQKTLGLAMLVSFESQWNR